MSSEHKPNRRMCQVCPRRLSGPPDQPCSLALERILAIQADPRSDHDGVGCPWYIISQEHNYCFWSFAEELDAPMSDREIAEMLGLPVKEIDRIAAAALEKLQAIKDTPAMQAFQEAVHDRVASQQPDNTVYMPNQFREQVAEASKEANEALVGPNHENNKPKRGRGAQPIHRDGRKRDIYFAKGARKEAK